MALTVDCYVREVVDLLQNFSVGCHSQIGVSVWFYIQKSYILSFNSLFLTRWFQIVEVFWKICSSVLLEYLSDLLSKACVAWAIKYSESEFFSSWTGTWQKSRSQNEATIIAYTKILEYNNMFLVASGMYGQKTGENIWWWIFSRNSCSFRFWSIFDRFLIDSFDWLCTIDGKLDLSWDCTRSCVMFFGLKI